MRIPTGVILGVVMIGGIGSARADDLLPPDRPIEEVVDSYVGAKLAREGVGPAPEADDATIVRRLTLDLVGRIPTAEEARLYVECSAPDKKAKLVDRLMASPGFVRHGADWFDAMLMAGTRGDLRDYLTRAFGENRSWDRVFREILAADEADASNKGSSGFLKARAKDTDRLTSDVSSVFFGVNVSCAKCHDHPKVQDWKQDHYYGMKSFLDRTVEVGGFVGEREFGSVKFKTTEGEERHAKFMFLTGKVVEVPGVQEPSKDEKAAEKKRLDESKKRKEAPEPPKFSARGKLAEIALEPGERDFFARSIANRLWHRFFGQGLVSPLDQMHSENPPSHPELLQWLARDTIDHGYDLRRLTRGLVLSRAYSRTSRWESAEPPSPKWFAVGAVRPLSPMQLALSMWVATTDPASLADDADRKIEGLAGRAEGSPPPSPGPARTIRSAPPRPC